MITLFDTFARQLGVLASGIALLNLMREIKKLCSREENSLRHVILPEWIFFSAAARGAHFITAEESKTAL